MKELKLITESAAPVEMVKEAFDPGKPKTLKFKGIFLQSEKRNGNNRIYPYKELKPEVDRFIEEMVNTDRALSELEHPERCDINPDRACSRILSLEEDNKQWIGEAVILATDEKHGIKGTPCGDILAALANYGTAFGMSSRAMGEVDKDGYVSSLHLVTIDTVLNPSIGEMCGNNGNRFVNGILESKSFVIDTHGQIVESAYEKLSKRLKKMPNTNISTKKAEYLGAAVTEFFNSLV